MADEDRAVEGGVADGMRIGIGIDDVAAGSRSLLRSRQRPAPFAHAAAAIDHGDGVAADDKCRGWRWRPRSAA